MSEVVNSPLELHSYAYGSCVSAPPITLMKVAENWQAFIIRVHNLWTE